MRATHVSVPELALIAGTRALLGAGIGLLMADCFEKPQRRAVGWTLFSVGALSTIPLAFEVLGGGRLSRSKIGTMSENERRSTERISREPMSNERVACGI